MDCTQIQNIQQHNFGQNRNINLICLDIGKTVGIAQKRTRDGFASDLNLSLNKAVTYVAGTVRASVPTLLVVGHPVMLTGKRSAQTLAVENVVKNMRQRLKVPIVLWDERLTTKWACKHQHCAAAALILQSFLNAIISDRETPQRRLRPNLELVAREGGKIDKEVRAKLTAPTQPCSLKSLVCQKKKKKKG
ncbi:Putative pre-16S rRNA nuclease [Candidatus Hodgkinia cicadicola]|nr:Putative pre-16S rRNA nuclease [Candidatus Hodgkinia cicadicola]